MNKQHGSSTRISGPRVLIVAASPRYIGGQSVMAQRLLQDLASDGITVGFLPVDPLVPRFLQGLDQIKYVRTIVRTIFYVWALVCNVPKYDVIHIFSASYSSFLISPAPALIISRLFGKASILNYHSGEAEDHLRRSGFITKTLLNVATFIVVPSDYLVTVFAHYNFDTIAIFNHIDISCFNYRERQGLHPRVIVARTLDSLYNIPCALRAFGLVQKRHPQAELVILGDGPQRKLLEQQTRDLGLRNVDFRGFVQRSEIPLLFDEADIFLNTSSIDNMPVSILEAFAAGLPVVTTNAGGIPYIVTDGITGLVTKVDDHTGLAEKMLGLINDPDKTRHLSQQGRNEVAKYTWGGVRDQWISVYQQAKDASTHCQSVGQKQCKKIA